MLTSERWRVSQILVLLDVWENEIQIENFSTNKIGLLLQNWNIVESGVKHHHLNLNSDKLTRLQTNHSLLLLSNAACLAEKQQIPML